MNEFLAPRAGPATCPPHGFNAPSAQQRFAGDRAKCFWCGQECEVTVYRHTTYGDLHQWTEVRDE